MIPCGGLIASAVMDTPPESVCRCELNTLMSVGCQCGAFEMEQKAKQQQKDDDNDDGG